MNKERLITKHLPQRRWDIDWLRILIVLMLVPYHTARVFDYDPFFVKNDELTDIFTYWFVRVGDAFAMELLFLLAGAATWFALRRRSGGQYARERFRRLLVPFIFGIFVLAPPNAYFALRNHTDYAGSFLEFYPHFFEVSPAGLLDFTGGFTMAHLWFIFFLFIFSLLALPLFLFLRRDSRQMLIQTIAKPFTWPGTIFLLVIPFLAIEWLLVISPNLLLIIIFYLIFYIYGYVMIADERFGMAIDRHKFVALILGPVLYLILGLFRANTLLPEWLQVLYFRSLFPWLTIIAVLGYGRKFLGSPPKSRVSTGFLLYFGEGSYPFYLLHQTVLVAIAFYIVQLQAGIALKSIVIATATYAGTLLLYEFLVRRTNLTRFLFGMRLLQRRASEEPSAKPGETRT